MAVPSPSTCQENFEQAVGLALHLWPALSLAVQNGWGGPDSDDKRAWFAGAVAELFPEITRVLEEGQGGRLQQQQQQQQPTRHRQHQQLRNLQPAQPPASSPWSGQQQAARRLLSSLQQQQQQQQQQPTGASSSPSLASSSPRPAAAAAAATATVHQDEPELDDLEAVLLQVMMDEFDVNLEDGSAVEVADSIMRARAGCLRGSFAEVDAMQHRWEASRGKRVAGVQAAADPGSNEGESSDDDDDDDDEGGDWSSADGSGEEGEEEDVDMTDAPALGKEGESRRQPEMDGDGFTKVTRRKR